MFKSLWLLLAALACFLEATLSHGKALESREALAALTIRQRVEMLDAVQVRLAKGEKLNPVFTAIGHFYDGFVSSAVQEVMPERLKALRRTITSAKALDMPQLMGELTGLGVMGLGRLEFVRLQELAFIPLRGYLWPSLNRVKDSKRLEKHYKDYVSQVIKSAWPEVKTAALNKAVDFEAQLAFAKPRSQAPQSYSLKDWQAENPLLGQKFFRALDLRPQNLKILNPIALQQNINGFNKLPRKAQQAWLVFRSFHSFASLSGERIRRLHQSFQYSELGASLVPYAAAYGLSLIERLMPYQLGEAYALAFFWPDWRKQLQEQAAALKKHLEERLSQLQAIPQAKRQKLLAALTKTRFVIAYPDGYRSPQLRLAKAGFIDHLWSLQRQRLQERLSGQGGIARALHSWNPHYVGLVSQRLVFWSVARLQEPFLYREAKGWSYLQRSAKLIWRDGQRYTLALAASEQIAVSDAGQQAIIKALEDVPVLKSGGKAPPPRYRLYTCLRSGDCSL